NMPLGPDLERMRSAAANTDIEQLRGPTNGVTQRAQVGEQPRVCALHRAGDFDHALGDLELDVEFRMPFLDQRQKVGCGACEVAVTPVDKLQLQLYAERERLGGL